MCFIGIHKYNNCSFTALKIRSGVNIRFKYKSRKLEYINIRVLEVEKIQKSSMPKYSCKTEIDLQFYTVYGKQQKKSSFLSGRASKRWGRGAKRVCH